MEIDNNVVGYLKFDGPTVSEGKMDASKAGSALLAVGRMFKKYCDYKGTTDVVIKLDCVKKKCTWIQFCVGLTAGAVTLHQSLKAVGLDEFLKQYWGTIAQQIALRQFSAGQRITKTAEVIVDSQQCVMIRNVNGDERRFLRETFETRRLYSLNIKELSLLEKGKEESMQLGYLDAGKECNLVDVKYADAGCFEYDEDVSIEARQNQEFDEENAVEMKLVGQFMNFYAMAHKYKFTFQARKNQEEVGKQYILCIIDGSKINEFIDLLKPENKERNVCIWGKATKDIDDKVDKIKISHWSYDESDDPNQQKFLN